jgi:NAD(P)-dependent dehydrogenase (short-subunit alcohol dehydrogenase family)
MTADPGVDTGYTVLITGASGGIGKLLCGHFANKGITAFGTSFRSDNPGSSLDQVDVSSFAAVDDWAKRRIPPGGRIVLINCAGVTYNAMTHNSDPAQWAEVITVNLLGAYHAIRAVLPSMRAAGYGRIINFGSVVGQRGAIGASAYAASKAALQGLTKSVSLENAGKGITVNTINLGYFSIGMIDKVPEKLLVKIVEQIPTGRLGHPASILSTVDFLIDTADITGAALDVNGGLY